MNKRFNNLFIVLIVITLAIYIKLCYMTYNDSIAYENGYKDGYDKALRECLLILNKANGTDSTSKLIVDDSKCKYVFYMKHKND